MSKKIDWTDQAKADLRAIDQSTALRILHIVGRYLATGEGDLKRLQNIEPPEFVSASVIIVFASMITENPLWSSPSNIAVKSTAERSCASVTTGSCCVC